MHTGGGGKVEVLKQDEFKKIFKKVVIIIELNQKIEDPRKYVHNIVDQYVWIKTSSTPNPGDPGYP